MIILGNAVKRNFNNFVGVQMNKGKDGNNITETNNPEDTAKFISSDVDEKEGNFEFLCCRGGTTCPNGGSEGIIPLVCN